MKRSETAKSTAGVWVALLALSVLLFSNQYLTLRRLKEFILAKSIGNSMPNMMAGTPRLILEEWRNIFDPSDFLIGLLILGIVVALVLAERRRRSLTAFVQSLETSAALRYAFLGYVALLATRCYLNPGEIFMGDTETHTIRSAMVAEHFRNLTLPVWSNYWYGGYPLLQYYAPLFFLVDGLLTVLLGDIHLATKLVLWSTHVGSVFTMYFYLARVSNRVLPAVLGAVAYGVAFHRLHMILYRGDLQLSILFLLYPLIFLCVERILDPRFRTKSSFLSLTALVFLMIFNHQGYAFFGLIFLSLYVLVRVATTSGAPIDKLRQLSLFGFAATGALLLSIFLLVPFVLGMNDVRGMPGTPYGFLIPNPRAPLLLLPMFRWSPIGRVENVGYMGLSIGLFAVLGAAYGMRRRSSVPMSLAFAAAASLFMSRNFEQYNIKNANFFMFFLAALAAFAPMALEESRRLRFLARWRESFGAAFPARLTLALLALLALDLGPTTFHSVYREGYDFKEKMYAHLRELDDDARVIEHQRLHYSPDEDPRKRFDKFKLGTPSAHSRIFTPLGFFHEGAGKSFGYNIEIVKSLHRDLMTGCVSDLTAEGLYLMGVKFVIFRDRYRYFSPKLEPSDSFTLQDDVLTLRQSTPLIFSTQVVTTEDVAGFDRGNPIDTRRYFDPETYDYSGRLFRELVVPLLETMEIDRERGVARRLVARDGDLPKSSLDPDGLSVSVKDFEIAIDRTSVRYWSSADAIGQLSLNYFPFLDVRVDGVPIAFRPSATNTILAPLPAGEHVLTVRGRASSLRTTTFWISVGVLVLLLALPRSVFRVFRPGASA